MRTKAEKSGLALAGSSPDSSRHWAVRPSQSGWAR